MTAEKVSKMIKKPRAPHMSRMNAKSRLSIVLPCFNEEAVLPLTNRGIFETLGKQSDIELEVVYVNDGSSDATETILAEYAAHDPRIKVVSLTRNFGHQAAISAGLAYASGDAVVIADADLQDPPSAISTMLRKWHEGFDVVYGIRRKRKEIFWKRAAYAVFYRLYRASTEINAPLDSGDFALLDRKVVDAMNALPEKNRFVRGLRSWVGFRQVGIEYERAKRATGDTKYSLSKLVKLAGDGIFNFSTVPLSWIFSLGVVCSMLSFFGLGFFVIWRLVDFKILGRSPEDVPGFTSVILAILFFSGIQLVSVGILGKYLGRVYEEVKNRPTYMVSRVFQSDRALLSRDKA